MKRKISRRGAERAENAEEELAGSGNLPLRYV
jgi:hypothetical protein